MRHSSKFFLFYILTTLILPISCLKAETIITDAAGRKVKLPDKVQRIVTTFKPATLSVICLGLTETLVGVDTSSRQDPLNLAVEPNLANLPGVGSKSHGINLETVLGLNPDLVILYSQKTGIQLARRLERSGCAAMVIKPETFPSIRCTLRLLASAIGQPESSNRVIKSIDRVLNLVQNRVQNIKPFNRKRAYYAAPTGFLTTTPSGMLQSKMIQAAGGINVASELHGYFQHISAEQLIDWSPDCILINRLIALQAQDMLENPRFSHLPAVKQDKIYVFPSNLAPWDFPSPLSAIAVLWISKKLYPSQFADISILQEVNTFHQNLFGLSMTQMKGKLDDRLPIKYPMRGHEHSLSDEIKDHPK